MFRHFERVHLPRCEMFRHLERVHLPDESLERRKSRVTRAGRCARHGALVPAGSIETIDESHPKNKDTHDKEFNAEAYTTAHIAYNTYAYFIVRALLCQ
eukprot:1183784-Prorocentrum_minimum.AAC.2